MAEAASRRFSWQQTFAALKYPNYRLWFYGQLVSLFGTWMQSTAQGYLIYQLTHSSAYLGIVAFAGGVPTWLLMLYAGVVADRVPKRTILVITQTSMMILAFVLALLAFTGVVQPWHIVLLAALLGVANAFDAPARQAFTFEMVERKDLTNAIALNATMFNMATAVGPAVAGVTYALVGPAWCFVINGLSFVAVIVALLLMHIKPAPVLTFHQSSWVDMREGLSYSVNHAAIRSLILMVGCISLFALSFTNLFPAWATDVLHGDSTTNGLLQSARGIGALLGALTIASLGNFNKRGKLLTLGTIIMPVALLIFAVVRWLPLSLLLLVIVGMASILAMNLANALVQTLSPDLLRGRVMGAYSMVFFGSMPLGGLMIGALAERVGPPLAVILGASAWGLVVVALLVFAPHLRKLE